MVCGAINLCCFLRFLGSDCADIAEVMPFDIGEVFELLRRIEEVQIRTAQGSGAEYLGALISQLKKGGEYEALRELESVRFALARYFARCSVLSIGGRGHLLNETG